MFPNIFKSLFTKLALFSMVLSLVAPYAPLVQADPDDPINGTLVVSTNHDAAAYSIYLTNDHSTAVATGSGMGPNEHPLLQGLYDVVFEDVAEYVSPVPVTEIAILTGAVVTLPTAAYLPENSNPTGMLTVSTNNDLATYNVVDSATGETVATGNGTGPNEQPLLQGLYDVTFGDVDGYVTPSTFEDVAVIANENTDVLGNYVAEGQNPTGTLVISSNLDDAAYSVVDAATGQTVVDGQGAGPNEHPLLQGLYDVSFDDVEGYETPEMVEDVQVIADETVQLPTFLYTAIQTNPTGTLSVTMNHDAGSFEVFNTEDLETPVATVDSGSVSANSATDLPLVQGLYAVVYGDVDGYTKPADESNVVVVADETTVLYGNYTQVPQSGSVVVNVIDQDGNPVTDGDWYLNQCTGVNVSSDCNLGYSNGSDSTTLNNVPAGLYGLKWTVPAPYASAVLFSQNPQVLDAQETIDFTLQYSMEPEVSNKIAQINVTTIADLGETVTNQFEDVNGPVVLNGIPAGNAPVSLFVDVTQENTLSFLEYGPNSTPPADKVYAANTLAAEQVENYEAVYTTEMARVKVYTQTAGGDSVPANVTVGTFDGTTPPYPFSMLVNVVDKPNDVTVMCGQATEPGFELLQTNPIIISDVEPGTVRETTCTYDVIELTTLSVQARLEDGGFTQAEFDHYVGVYPNGIKQNALPYSTIASGNPKLIENVEADMPQYLVFEDKADYVTPATEGDAYVLTLPLDQPTHVVDVTYLLNQAKFEVTVSGLSAGEETTVTLYEGDSTDGPIVDQVQTGIGTVSFGVEPDGTLYTTACSLTVNDKILPEAQATKTHAANEVASYKHTCTYIQNAATIIATTSPVPATITLVNNNDGSEVTSKTSVLKLPETDPAEYAMKTEDYFVVDASGTNENFTIKYNPVPGVVDGDTAYTTPGDDLLQKDLQPSSVEFLPTATYIETDEKEFLQIHTEGYAEAAIFVDGIEVRAEGEAAAVTVPISTTEEHVVSFQSNVASMVTPFDIVIPAGNEAERKDTTRYILGYYAELGDENLLYVNSRNTTGEVFMQLNTDPTLYYFGVSGANEDGSDYLNINVDVKNDHVLSFEDKEDYVLANIFTATNPQATPTLEMPAGSLEAEGVTSVRADYILKANAAYFKAGIKNQDAAFFNDVTVKIDFDNSIVFDEEFYLPANEDNGITFTDVFVVDIVNDFNTVSFLNPVTLDDEDYTPVPTSHALTEALYPGGKADGQPGSASLPYTLTTTYQPANGLAKINVTVVGDDASSIQLTSANGDVTVISDVADGDFAQFETVVIGTDNTITCGPGESGNTVTPQPIFIPANSLAGGFNYFACVYVPTDTNAVITVLTEASDDADLTAPITLDIEGEEYVIGYTQSTDENQPASLTTNVDATKATIIKFGDVDGYATPADKPVDAPVGSTTSVYKGTYVPEAEAATVVINTLLSDTGELTDASENNIVVNGEAIAKNTYTTLVDLSQLADNPITVSFADVIEGYTVPANVILNTDTVAAGTNTFDVHYVPTASAGYISVNTQGANSEITLNGNVIGTSTDGGFVGPVLIDTALEDGNTLSFTTEAANFVKPADIVIPQGVTSISTDVLAPTQFTGVYTLEATAASFSVQAIESDTGDVLPLAEIRLNGLIIGYGEVVDYAVDGLAENTLSFGGVDGFETPLPVVLDLTPGESDNFAGVYIPTENGFSTITIKTVDSQDPANTLNAPIHFSIEGGLNAFSFGKGEVIVNVDNTVTNNEIYYETSFIDSDGQGYKLLDPATGLQELTLPYASEYLAVYDLDLIATAAITTADDDVDYTVGVADAKIVVNGTSVGTQKVESYEFIANEPTVVSFDDHPNDATYKTPLPIFFTPIGGRTYPTILGHYTHSCEITINLVDINGNAVDGEVTGTINDDPELFFYGTPEPGEQAVKVIIDENDKNEFYIAAPTPNPTNLQPDVDTITIEAGELVGQCPASYTVIFTPVSTDAFVNITTVDDAGNDIAGSVLFDGTVISDANGNVSGFEVDVTQENTFTFGPVSNFDTPLPRTFAANSLTPGEVVNLTIVYTTPQQNATLILDAQDANDSSVQLNADISLSIDGGEPVFQGKDYVEVLVNINHDYEVVWGKVDGYLEPDPTPVPTLIFNAVETIVGLYNPCVGDCEVVQVNAFGPDGITILPEAPITITNNTTGAVASGFGQLSKTYNVGDSLDIEFGQLPLYQAPQLNFANPVTVDSNAVNNIFSATYFFKDEFILDFEAQDADGNSLNDLTQLDINNGQAVVDLPHLLETNDLSSSVFAYLDLDGFVTPKAMTVTDAVTTVPAGMQVTETLTTDGTEVIYNEGDELTFQKPQFATYLIAGVYVPNFTITKTANVIEAFDKNVVTYTIVVQRNATEGSTVIATIKDTVSLKGSIFGQNGGSLAVIPNSSNLSGVACDEDHKDITKGPLTCHFDNPDSKLTLTYDTRADSNPHDGILLKEGEISEAVNTASLSYAGLVTPLEASATVTLKGEEPAEPGEIVPVVPETSSTSGGGGGTGDGGGHIMYEGEMELGIQKFLSLDGKHFIEANAEGAALILPENEISTVYVKVRITNDNPVSAKDIRFRHHFNTGNSDMAADTFRSLKGAKYKEKYDVIVVDKVIAGKSKDFVYKVDVNEQGQSDQFAFDTLELIYFKSTLPVFQDGLTYVGLGEMISSYLIAGQLPEGVVPTVQQLVGPALEITVQPSTATVQVGEPVSTNVLVTNTGTVDLTNMVIKHNYDESTLQITNPGGATNDGNELSWVRAVLAPGKTATYTFTAMPTAFVSDLVRSTTRAVVDEFDNKADVESFITLLPGAAKQPYQLAKTGAMDILGLMMMLVLAYFMHQAYQRKRYVQLKRLALQPL